MPLHMTPLDVSGELANAGSVLIVSCPVCPPVSLAIQRNSPFIDLFKSGLKTRAFEDYIREIREPLEQRGVRTGVFSAYAPLPTMCLWTRGQRKRLRKRAENFDAVLVLGCDSATQTVKQALEGLECRIVPAMQMTGITNATMRFRFPLTLDLEEVTRVAERHETGEDAS